jgi:hypothetical protein
MNVGDQPLPLGPTGRDRAVALARAVAGMVPVVGPLIAELITEVVPGQRQERIEDWLRQLAQQLASVEHATLLERLRKPENVALFEEGAYQAVRAISEERRQQIAELVAGGIADDRGDYLESRRLLRLLGELDDAEVVLLAAYLPRYSLDPEHWQRHANLLPPSFSRRGLSREERWEVAIREAGLDQLLRLKLLEEGVTRGHSGVALTPLGRLLLRRIGLDR